MRRVPPGRQTGRFVLAALVGFIPVGTALIYELGLESVPAMATTITLGGAVVRVMSMEVTERWLDRFMPWLSSDYVEEIDDVTKRDDPA